MRTYQTLGLIGAIIGIFMSLILVAIGGVLTGLIEVGQNMSESFPMTQEEQRRAAEQRARNEQTIAEGSAFAAGNFLAFIIHIAIIPILFAVKKKTKAVGIVLIVLGIIAIISTNGYGIIPFALYLPAAILAFRYKPKKYKLVEEKGDEEE